MNGTWNKVSHLWRGIAAENYALEYLNGHGLRLLERNFRTRRGEIDLVMEDGEDIVFVEVRYRKTNEFGSAVESVDRKKQARLIACAAQYLSEKGIGKGSRFDVVGISPDRSGWSIHWVRDAFQAG